MVVTDEVQRTVHDEMRPVRLEVLTLLARLAAQHGGTDHEITQRLLRPLGQGRRRK